MPGLHGDTPEEAFTGFRNHLNDLLHRTVTQAPLTQLISGQRAFLEFRQGGNSIAVPVGRGYHLFLGQTLEANKVKGNGYRLRTIAYAYRIANGPNRTDDWLVRWEYNSRDHQPGFHPRHHCHLRTEIEFLNRTLSLEKWHISSGWVTIEEVIRFLIHELKVPPKRADWDRRLHASEEKFRQWTGRDA